jgi:ribose transport system permease protein
MSERPEYRSKAADAEVRRSPSSPVVRQYGGILVSLAVLCVVFSVLNPRFIAGQQLHERACSRWR